MIFNDREVKPYKITEDKDTLLNTNNTEKKILVTDFDDTLALTAIKHFHLVQNSKNVETYKKYMNINQTSQRFFYSRTEYYTSKWLKRPEVDEIPKEIANEITDLFNLPDFYDDVKPTKFAIALKEYLKQPYCEKIYVISHCLSDTAADAKIKWLVDFYKDCNPEKIEFIPTTDTRKSIPIMERGIKWDIFADDRLECIYDMVLYGQGFGNEILIPEFGYNKPTERFSNLVEKFNLQTFYMNVL